MYFTEKVFLQYLYCSQFQLMFSFFFCHVCHLFQDIQCLLLSHFFFFKLPQNFHVYFVRPSGVFFEYFFEDCHGLTKEIFTVLFWSVLCPVHVWLAKDIVTRMHLSVGTSLAIIIPTSIISTKTHMEHDAVDLKMVKSFGIFILIGVIL